MKTKPIDDIASGNVKSTSKKLGYSNKLEWYNIDKVVVKHRAMTNKIRVISNLNISNTNKLMLFRITAYDHQTAGAPTIILAQCLTSTTGSGIAYPFTHKSNSNNQSVITISTKEDGNIIIDITCSKYSYFYIEELSENLYGFSVVEIGS